MAAIVYSFSSQPPPLCNTTTVTATLHTSGNLRVVFAAGGTGGHIYPAIAIADELKYLNPKTQFLFVGTPTGMEAAVVPSAGYPFTAVPTASLARPLFSIKNIFILPFILIKSIFKSYEILREFNPHIVIGTGGFVSFPTCFAAAIKGSKLLLQEQNSAPGIANLALSLFADRICVAFNSSVGQFWRRDKCFVCGNPVRLSLMNNAPKAAAMRNFFPVVEAEGKATVVVVLGGSLGANAINIALLNMYYQMLNENDELFIIWQTGLKAFGEMESLVKAHPRLLLSPFLHDMDLAYAAADLVVSRAGAMTCYEILVTGKPSILIPSPYVAEGHQIKNAHLMADVAGSRVIMEDELDSAILKNAIQDIMDNETLMKEMSTRALQAAKPNASTEIAQLIISLYSGADLSFGMITENTLTNFQQIVGFDLETYKNNTRIDKQLEAPMPWIGMYIAAASFICSLAMAADAFKGFQSKRFWFPCKCFSLNATFLTLLAVAMKLTVDLTTTMFANIDWLSKLSSLIFMSISIANFMPSLGESMNEREIVTNVMALGILVITVIVNVWIQLIQLQPIMAVGAMVGELLLSTIYMLLLLVALVSSAITIPTTKKFVESKYQEMQKAAQREVEWKMTLNREAAMKQWIMAETGSPQFVLARSVVCISANAICMVAALTLTEAYIRAIILCKGVKSFWEAESVYGWSTKWILFVQSFGVAVGTIAPIMRWFHAVSFKCLENPHKSFSMEFRIQRYWIQRLVEWRDSNLSGSLIQNHHCRRCVHGAKGLTLNFFIAAQVVIVGVSRLVARFSAWLVRPFFSFFSPTNDHKKGKDTEMDLSPYALLLEGEAKLPRRTIMSICCQMDEVIQRGKRLQPKNLINLLLNLGNLRGAIEFDSILVPSLHSQEPPNCWSLPVVTLTSIAVSLPSIANHKGRQLVRSVGEGLSLVRLIETAVDKNGELISIRNAASMVWVRVELFHKWHDEDLHEASLKGRCSMEVVKELSGKAERLVLEFKKDVKDILMENPVNWPAKIIAANSMYRTSRTILQGIDQQTDPEALFDRLTNMIADILGACLTNLEHFITTKCHPSAIEEREKSVREAFLLLGKTRQIIDLLQQYEWPCLDPDEALYIDKWRARFHHDNENPLPS